MEKRYKILITDRLVDRMVGETREKFPEYAERIDYVLVEEGNEEELIEKAPGVDIMAGAR